MASWHSEKWAPSGRGQGGHCVGCSDGGRWGPPHELSGHLPIHATA